MAVVGTIWRQYIDVCASGIIFNIVGKREKKPCVQVYMFRA